MLEACFDLLRKKRRLFIFFVWLVLDDAGPELRSGKGYLLVLVVQCTNHKLTYLLEVF